eukprot:Clim_evm18s249 gene=Clim_evmTU18s249
MSLSVLGKSLAIGWRSVAPCARTATGASLVNRVRRTFATVPVEVEPGHQHNVPALWLRDHCMCPECFHRDTGMKLTDTAALNPNVHHRATNSNDSTLNIEWSDGHTGVYDQEWLKKVLNKEEAQAAAKKTTNVNTHSYHYGNGQGPRAIADLSGGADLSSALPRKSWSAAEMEAVKNEWAWQDVANDDSVLKEWLTFLHERGVARMTGVPSKSKSTETGTEEPSVLSVARRIATYPRETSYGPFFDVRTEPDPKAHLAFKSVALDFHSDMNYRENSPGVQLLHCLANEAEGGDSLYVDGLKAAEMLKDESEELFRSLASTACEFRVKTAGRVYRRVAPVLVSGINVATGEEEVSEIHLNNRTMAMPHFEGQDQRQLMTYYEAYRRFNELVREEANVWRFSMNSGDLVVFNNRRALHARDSFDPQTGLRHLQGAYADLDEIYARLRAFDYE